MPSVFTRIVLISLVITTVVAGQIPTDEAARRLKARLATRPSTQPSAEVDRLREENLRLRERVMSLQEEIATLKQVLAHGNPPTSGPSTQPTTVAGSDTLQKALIGRWRGGDITAGSGYLLQFDPDGSYKQTFISNNQRDAGQYRAFDDNNTMEMWSHKTPEDRKHNQYRLTLAPGQITLTPILIDGLPVKTARPLVLSKAE